MSPASAQEVGCLGSGACAEGQRLERLRYGSGRRVGCANSAEVLGYALWQSVLSGRTGSASFAASSIWRRRAALGTASSTHGADSQSDMAALPWRWPARLVCLPVAIAP